jgi:polar amino acid transport system permease protein
MLAIKGGGTRPNRIRRMSPEEFGRRKFAWTLRETRYVAVNVIAYLATIFTIGWLAVRGAQSFGYNWQWYRVPAFLFRVIDGEIYPGPLMRGVMVTLEVSAYSLVLAIIFGLIGAVLRLSPSRVGSFIGMLYVETIRNMPLLIQMYLFYFVLAQILKIDRFPAAVWCLATFQGAYLTEIFRAGIQSVPRGQWEAALSLGLRNGITFWKIILPQAVRLVIPPLTNQSISLVKQSAIVSVIAVFDLATEGRNVIADTFMTFEIWLTVAFIYLCITTLMSLTAGRIEALVRR